MRNILYSILILFAACKNSSPVEEQAQHNTDSTHFVALTTEQMKTIKVAIGGIENKNIATFVKANGQVSVLNENKALITTQFAGTIQNINVHSGSMVKAGEVIATISNPDFINVQEEYLTVMSQLNAGSSENIAAVANSQFANLQEQYNGLQPQIDLAEAEVKRQNELKNSNAGSTKTLQQAEAALTVLRSKRSTLYNQMNVFSRHADLSLKTKKAALENRLQLMGINPKTLTPDRIQTILSVRSPITGKISNIAAKIGSFISENNAVAEVIDLNQLHLDLNVYEADIAKFQIGQTLSFTVINNPSQTYTAEVHTIGAALDPQTKTIEVHAHINGNKVGLVEGISVAATVHLNKTATTAVPNSAIVQHDGQDFIFVQRQITEKTILFEQIPIQKGPTEGSYTAISCIKPLSPNDKIALTNAFFILGKMINTEE